MSPAIQALIDQLEKLPGVGPKTAERFAYYLLKRPVDELDTLLSTLSGIRNQIKRCRVCQNVGLSDPCEICSDRHRQHGLICVVAEPQDVLAIEKTNEFSGLYHVLNGTINAPEGITPNHLTVKELWQRIKSLQTQKLSVEIILGLNANIEGETTTLYLIRLLKPSGIKITRLARGLPQGADLQYADEITLINALKGRREA